MNRSAAGNWSIHDIACLQSCEGSDSECGARRAKTVVERERTCCDARNARVISCPSKCQAAGARFGQSTGAATVVGNVIDSTGAVTFVVVPEPSTALLLGLGAGIAGVARRRRPVVA